MSQHCLVIQLSMEVVEMILKISVPGAAQIDVIGHALGELSFISEFIFLPASLLDGEICDQAHTYLHSLQTFGFLLAPGISDEFQQSQVLLHAHMLLVDSCHRMPRVLTTMYGSLQDPR
jgi:hypothetical protein